MPLRPAVTRLALSALYPVAPDPTGFCRLVFSISLFGISSRRVSFAPLVKLPSLWPPSLGQLDPRCKKNHPTVSPCSSRYQAVIQAYWCHCAEGYFLGPTYSAGSREWQSRAQKLLTRASSLNLATALVRPHTQQQRLELT